MLIATIVGSLACGGGGDGGYTPADGYGGGGGYGGGASGPCHDACTNLSQCGVQDYAACASECSLVSESDLVAYAGMSCTDLQALAGGGGGGGGGNDGTACMREGIDDCPGTSMCCYDGRAAYRYEQGLCLEAGTCFAPR